MVGLRGMEGQGGQLRICDISGPGRAFSLRAVSLHSENLVFKLLRKIRNYLPVGYLQGIERQSCKGGPPYSRSGGKMKMAEILESNCL